MTKTPTIHTGRMWNGPPPRAIIPVPSDIAEIMKRRLVYLSNETIVFDSGITDKQFKDIDQIRLLRCVESNIDFIGSEETINWTGVVVDYTREKP